MRRTYGPALGLAVARSPDKVGAAYTLGVWVTGSPVATDPSPNVTPPAASRILTLQPRQALMCAGAGTLRSIAIGGTSITYNVWRYDVLLATWLQVPGSATITVATTNIATLSATVGTTPGSKWFLQPTAVTGVTAFGYGFT